MRIKYQIHTLSARALIGYAQSEEDKYIFDLSRTATEKCFVRGDSDEQEDNALFYQTMCVLHGKGFSMSDRSFAEGSLVISDLADVIFYIDFSGIFDRSGSKKYLDRQRKAEAMFRPEGITLDFGRGGNRYISFERSGSMSRQAKLSFIRADVYDEVHRRIMMDMTVGRCRLSKLYAYNGLMLSGGTRIDGIGITDPHRVVIVDIKKLSRNASVITVEGEGGSCAVKKYRRVETIKTIDILKFDGEGVISKEYARIIDRKLCGKHIHSSFQIRMPYIKGMLHEVDLKNFLKSAGCSFITDIYGMRHPIDDVDIVLTKSMFKGCDWLNENGMTWNDYLSVFRKYDHALYITNTGSRFCHTIFCGV